MELYKGYTSVVTTVEFKFGICKIHFRQFTTSVVTTVEFKSSSVIA